jgi:hypothetical protein
MTTTRLPSGFLDAVKRAHVHTQPTAINRTALVAEQQRALQKVMALASYRDYLAAARAQKAKGHAAPLALEYSVQDQARTAAADMTELGAAALSVTDQFRHGGMWNLIHDQASAGVTAAGPMHIADAWHDLKANEAWMEVVRSAGLTDEISTALDQAVGAINARLVADGGSLHLECTVPGAHAPQSCPLAKSETYDPATIGDLLGYDTFARVAAAYGDTSGFEPRLIPAVVPIAHDFADLVAMGAVAGRQRMIEHVRKLEDTGLETYAGEDPLSVLVVLFIVGAAAAIIGEVLYSMCEESGDPDSASCVAAFFVLTIACACLFGAAIILAGTGAGGIIVDVFLVLALGQLFSDTASSAGFLTPGFSESI